MPNSTRILVCFCLVASLTAFGALNETRHWRRAAQRLRIARAGIELTATAFAESDFAQD